MPPANGAVRWKPHVADDTRFAFAERVPYNEVPRWVFTRDGWEVRVAVPMLERVEVPEWSAR